MFIASLVFVNDMETIDLAIVTILTGIMFSVIVSFGFIKVEVFTSGFNVTSGNFESHVFEISGYNEPYPVLFLFISFFFIALFFKAGFGLWKKSLEGAETPSLPKRR
jgi:hypothetical protein